MTRRSVALQSCAVGSRTDASVQKSKALGIRFLDGSRAMRLATRAIPIPCERREIMRSSGELRYAGKRYFTFRFFRRKVGTSRSWPSTIVGSDFSKRPRFAGSRFICSAFSSFFAAAVFSGVALR